MFGSRRQGTVIAKGLKIVGSVTAEGLVWVYGQIEGELHSTSLVIDRDAHISGTVTAERVVVDGRVEGPIQGGKVILKSRAQIIGDIHHQSLAIESGAFLDGRAIRAQKNGQTVDKLASKSTQLKKRESLIRRIERAVPVETTRFAQLGIQTESPAPEASSKI
jgi:cytoskeletal protein CcmA (bactofilin family)